MSRTKVRPVTLVLGTFALFALAQLLFVGNSGCSGGAVCYRVTDCPIGDRCISGTCTHRVEVNSDGTTAASGTSSGGGATAAATAGAGGAPMTTGALTSAVAGASANDAGAANMSEAGVGGS